MPSPFPGMDPYLEGELWQEFHSTLANAIRQQLMPLLVPNYVAMLAKRYVYDSPIGLVGEADSFIFYPDAHIVETDPAPKQTQGGSVLAAPTKVLSIVDDTIPQLAIEIRDTSNRRLVTVIELLSPANKRGKGAVEYQEKRDALLKTKTHLLEIDFVRRGKRLLASNQLDAPYIVYLSRFTRRWEWPIWEMSLRKPLPTIPVPLLPPDEDIGLDLQAAVDASYATAHYELLIDYQQDPPLPSFLPDDHAWIRRQIVTQNHE